MDLIELTPARLRQAAALKERIEKLERELRSLLGSASSPSSSQKLHWTQTPEGKARLARSMRRSWQHRGRAADSPRANSAGPKKKHWTQTPAGKARMAKMMRKSWQSRRTAA
jgi:hypothetical protein